LVFATPLHLQAIRRYLDACGIRPPSAVFADARETLDRILCAGEVTFDGFSMALEPLLAGLRRAPDGAIRAYGEMVGLLWTDGRRDAAVALEDCWNRFLDSCACGLLCAYPIDVLGPDFQMSAVDDVLRTHTHVVPCGSNGDLDIATDRALYDTLGTAADRVRREMRVGMPAAWPSVAGPEARILWLREHLPHQAAEIVARAKDYYGALQRVRNERAGQI
jgi:hypothetical protein